MSSKRNWWIGCGIGCGAALLVVGGLAAGGYFFVKRTVRQAEDFSARAEEMNERFGPIEEHRLAVGESARRESVSRFLVVREELGDSIEGLESRIGRLAGKADDGRFGPLDMLSLTKDLPGLVSALLDHLSARTDVLLRNDMSLGEYLYLYAVIYYAGLEHEPDDGPPFPLISDEDDSPQPWNRSETKVRRERDQRIRAILNDLTLPMLRRQLEEAERNDESSEEWRAQLAAEVERMEDYRAALPWEQGLPTDLQTWIDELREPLEASYSALLNPVEVGTYDQD